MEMLILFVVYMMKNIEFIFDKLDKIFQTINKCEDGLDIFSLLDNICASEFKRLNWKKIF